MSERRSDGGMYDASSKSGAPSSRDKRGGRPRPGDPRGRGRAGEGPGKIETAALQVARELDKPILAKDLPAQLAALEKFLGAIGKLRLRSLDALEAEARGKVLTALLRVMRQTALEDPQAEAARQKVFATLAEVFRSLGDERRAGLSITEAGEARAATHLLAHTGEWDKVAALHEREGRLHEAAKLHLANESFTEGAKLLHRAGDAPAALEAAIRAKDQALVRAAAKALPRATRKKTLLAFGLGDLLLDLLASAGEWEEVARLYARAGQAADAARAYERAGKTHRAIAAFRDAGDDAEAARILDAEVQGKLVAGDRAGAASLLARFGAPLRAAELATDPILVHRYLLEAGEGVRAQKLAEQQAQRARAEGSLHDAAQWLLRGGDPSRAAAAYEEAAAFDKAAELFEQLEAWADAARCLEAAGQTERARELYARVGDTEALARLGR